VKFSFRSFAIGFGCAALSLGAVTYANAAGNKTLKACANKKTGAMRYISKGTCKKTETSLSWSQMGPQGLPGAAGAKGDAGAAGTNGVDGAKGDTGAAGTNGAAGSNGTNGQNFYAVDSTGKTLGPVISHCDGCNRDSVVGVLIDGKNWSFETSRYYISNSEPSNSAFAYKDSSCTQPWFVISNTWAPNPQEVRFDYGTSTTFATTSKAFSAVNTNVSWTGRSVYYWDWNSQTTRSNRICRTYTDGQKTTLAATSSLYEAVELTKPTYTAPLTIVAK
jgi:hypothetical protein